MSQDHIRNFAIIAHIDHGKSTLADRLLELTGTVAKREMQEQVLDTNPIERERGITIKLAPVRMEYKRFKNYDLGFRKETTEDSKLLNRKSYILNLIDTPGHVDFSYEVSRSLAACEGAILVVDASQGVQAQTLAHLHQARAHNLVVIPVINKIDLPNANIPLCVDALCDMGFKKEEVIKISAKTGENVEKVLEAIVERIPEPHGVPDKPLRALVFSSHYDPHKGVVAFVRVVDGAIGGAEVGEEGRFGETFFGDIRPPQPQSRDVSPSSLNEAPHIRQSDRRERHSGRGFSAPQNARLRSLRLRFLASGAEVTPVEIGYFGPKMIPCDTLSSGEVGYIATGLKDARLARVGDTITESRHALGGTRYAKNALTHHASRITPLPGYQEPKPMVFLGLYPVNADDYQAAREAMERLRLSDSAFTFRPVSSLALGHGFHCGFLGLLHAEVVQERLLREFGISMLATAPSVEYRITLRGPYRGSRFDSSRQGPDVPPTHNLSGAKAVTGLENTRRAGPTQYITIQSAAEFPDPSLIEEAREPVMKVTIYSPKLFVGAIMQLGQEKRGEYIDLKYQAEQAEFIYLIPLSEMIVDFFDRLKSVTEGYASLDYEFFDYQPVELVKVDILVNHEKVDALSFLVVTEESRHRSLAMVERLAEVIPRHQFAIPIQASVGSPRSGGAGGKIIARADVKPFRKDVTKKLYGGDRSRKDKLLEAQKKGKARMKLVGRVEIPQAAFLAVLKRA